MAVAPLLSHNATTKFQVPNSTRRLRQLPLHLKRRMVLPAKEEEPMKAKAEEPVKEEEPDVEELVVQYQDWVNSMLAEGVLDEQFSQLQMLQDEDNPDVLDGMVNAFLIVSEKPLEDLSGSLKKDPVDYKDVDRYVHFLEGKSASIGAHQIMETCSTFRYCCQKEVEQWKTDEQRKKYEQRKKDECLDHLEKVKEEFNIVKSKLGKMLELEKRIVAAGGVVPSVDC